MKKILFLSTIIILTSIPAVYIAVDFYAKREIDKYVKMKLSEVDIVYDKLAYTNVGWCKYSVNVVYKSSSKVKNESVIAKWHFVNGVVVPEEN